MSHLCEYAIVICPKTGSQCRHKDCMEECNISRMSGVGHATFKDCLEIYECNCGSTYHRIQNVKKSIYACLRMIGFTEETNVDAMSYRKFKELVSALERTREDGFKYSRTTINDMIHNFSALGTVRLRDDYEDRGFTRPIFDIPKYDVPKKSVRGMTSEEAFKVKRWMWELSQSVKRLDKEMFKALFFEREFAVRPGDINRMTWSAIVLENGRRYLRYTPNKTKVYGKKSNIVIRDDLWRWIEPFVGEEGEPVLVRDPRGGKSKSGKYANAHGAVWNTINRRFRAMGICEGGRGKASYINRRARITEAFEKDGFRGAMSIGLNTPKVEMNHYISLGAYDA